MCMRMHAQMGKVFHVTFLLQTSPTNFTNKLLCTCTNLCTGTCTLYIVYMYMYVIVSVQTPAELASDHVHSFMNVIP